MKLKELEEKLDESLEAYRKETIFTVDTFNQKEYSEDAIKETLEQIGRQTFYTFYEFKKHIIEYLSEIERKG
ncbi:hypothetical protein FZC66_19390 [Priestia megaterium]|nr:hypothetical protein FZC66_19390 [Priestia megaterium]